MARETVPASNLEVFNVSPATGFLPEDPPSNLLEVINVNWGTIGRFLPKLLVSQKVKYMVDGLPSVDSLVLSGRSNRLDRALMRLLSFIGHAYVWENWKEGPRNIIPANLAIPWYQIASRLGRPPVLSYASYALDNWSLIDNKGPIELGNLYLIQNFLGGLDEEWFILVHVEIEARAAPALAAIGPAQEAVLDNNTEQLARQLTIIIKAQENMYKTLCRMTENCDPYIYYRRVRPYIHGFNKNPVIYEGVSEYENKPQTFFGETGAQSSIIPSLDAALEVTHQDDPLKTYLLKMAEYMPLRHRDFIKAIQAGPSIRSFVLESRAQSLNDIFQRCVQLLHQFREKHLEYAAQYIHTQSQSSPHNPTEHGTGGTPFMPYLKKHLDETK